MNSETVRTLILMTLCTIGGILIGLNSAHLSNALNVALFALGFVFVSMSITVESIFQTVLKRKGK